MSKVAAEPARKNADRTATPRERNAEFYSAGAGAPVENLKTVPQ